MSDQDDRNSALADAAYQEWQQDKEIAKLQNRIKELEAQIINPVQNNEQREFEKDIKDPVTVKYLKAPDVDVSKFNVTNEIIQVVITDQHEEQRTAGEFEKWLDNENCSDEFNAGAVAARDWILKKAYEIYKENNFLDYDKLKEVCKWTNPTHTNN